VKLLFSLIVLGVFFASCSLVMAEDCSGQLQRNYQTFCEQDSSCEWDQEDSTCQKKEEPNPCSKNSEFYCEPNGCHWDFDARESKKRA
jgi:hypothetical protein